MVNFSVSQKKTQADKMIKYHKMLTQIMRSFVESQDVGLLWQIDYPTIRTKHTIKFVFMLALCIVDMKGGKELCGQYGNNNKVKRPCISCYCPTDELDNPNQRCKPIIAKDFEKRILQDSFEDLVQISQHKVVDNVFFNVQMGGWKYGIWGICPSEILHQYYEGIVAYTLQYFTIEILTTASRKYLDKGVHQLINLCKNQSDRSLPQATYPNGITHYAKMRGTDKFAALFYLSLYFNTTDSKNMFEACHSKLTESQLEQWRYLFERMLFYHDWVMQESFERKDVMEKQTKIVQLFRDFKALVKREEGNGLKLPKMHEFLHACRDILRHGPARGYDTCPTESNHRPIKRLSQNTQRIHSRFEAQTAARMYEHNVIETSFQNAKFPDSFKSKFCKRNHQQSSSRNLIDTSKSNSAQGYYYLKYITQDITAN